MILTRIFVFVACCYILLGLSEAVKAECEYEYYTYSVLGSVYECNIQNDLEIHSKDSAVIDKAIGFHENVMTDKDVEIFYAYHGNIKFMPRGLEFVFANLKGIMIYEGRIKEIHQEDFKQLVKLKTLDLTSNDIEILEEGLFDYNPELKTISFKDNKIFHIDEHVFDNLHKLEILFLSFNKCIDKIAIINIAVKQLINDTKVMCKSDEYLSINNELKELEEDITSGSNKTCQEFELEMQEIEKQFQQSNISSHAVMKEKIQKVSNEAHSKFCLVDENSNIWIYVTFSIIGLILIVVLLVIYMKFFNKTLSAEGTSVTYIRHSNKN